MARTDRAAIQEGDNVGIFIYNHDTFGVACCTIIPDFDSVDRDASVRVLSHALLAAEYHSGMRARRSARGKEHRA